MSGEATWMRGGYGSCHIKNSCEDQVFRYDTLVLEECHVLIIICSACVYGIGDHDPCDSTSVRLVSCNKLHNLKDQIKYNKWLMHLVKHL